MSIKDSDNNFIDFFERWNKRLIAGVGRHSADYWI